MRDVIATTVCQLARNTLGKTSISELLSNFVDGRVRRRPKKGR